MIHQKRRKKLLSKIDNNNAVIIICTNSELKRNNDVLFPFRADSNFWYLTGFTEPDAIAVFSKNNYSIFLRPKNKEQEIWQGKRLGTDAAINKLLADNAYPIEKFKKIIKTLINKHSTIYYDNYTSNIFTKYIANNYNSKNIKPLYPYISEMRLIKEKVEIENMQKSAKIAAKAHQKAMKTVKPEMFEYEIMALFDAEFRKNNVEHAYNPIVASGKNACTLHYTKNNKILKNNELLLIDAGCEVQGYASDITRTFPINGKFSKEQSEIYNIVLQAQKAAIAKIMPNVCVNEAHKSACDIIENGLIKLGIIKNNLQLDEFYMHVTGHWLGLDVHDCGAYKVKNKFRKFSSGMVITVEPGIYIRENDKIDKKYWNIGIRIEDDVLITNSGNKILTESVVKEIKEIEQLMNN